MVKLNLIKTEQTNKKTENIDILGTREILCLMNKEDKKVAFAVEKELDNIEKAVEIIYDALSNGGRLIYCGCGTSGRLGILDAVECPPTFSTDPELVQAIIAGGMGAFVKAVEGAEDDYHLGEVDLKTLHFSERDVLVGIAASGRTPYVVGAVQYANKIGARTISLTGFPDSKLSELTEVSITPQTGAEVITGSTRLKCGTAQKLVLNMLSTSVMIKLGKVYGNLMVDLKATNEKLLERAVSIVVRATGVAEETARKVLSECNYSAKTAIVMIKCDCSKEDAEYEIMKAGGNISAILERNSK